MAKVSAGLLLYRIRGGRLEVFLVHPGGPFWKGRSEGAWSIPKGEFDEASEDALEAARREFAEETGHELPAGGCVAIGEVTQKAGKRVLAFAMEGDLDAGTIESNTFAMEWPPRSGRMVEFPEVDRAAWLGLDDARHAINPAQEAFLDRLVSVVGAG